uniref:Uncharacterized protein n=1 Tax=Tanacetum cinerariifolium TaxID=118510 RepID=A0A6L2L2D0_TANCI|nr:hypothetical protein [Tanacetum cinerariifolium]
MARLLFCDYHNMVAILEKGEHNSDFHPMVDFLEASPLRIKTTEEGTKILAIVDGIVRTVSESSLRRNLMLRDEDGISSLPDAELFENLTLMGYNISPNQKFTFQKDFIPMGSKEEAERYKRKGIRFDQESSKKLKSSEEVIEEAKSTNEILEEKIKEMMQLIPIK